MHTIHSSAISLVLPRAQDSNTFLTLRGFCSLHQRILTVPMVNNGDNNLLNVKNKNALKVLVVPQGPQNYLHLLRMNTIQIIVCW